MSGDELSRNKRVVEQFFEVIYGDGTNLHVFDEVVAEDYRQHNPAVAQGREGVKHFFVEVVGLPLSPELSSNGTETVRLVAEGDIVVRQEFRTQGMLIDVFRVHEGMIREHWDAFRVNPGQEPLPGF